MRHHFLTIIAFVCVHGANIGDNTLPVKSGIGVWIDVDTPKDQYEITSSRGGKWDLVMSDEFNSDRNFTAGEDHLWTALDIPDGVNRAIEYYDPKNAYTENGNFVIQIDSGERNITFFNSWGTTPSWENKTMVSAFVVCGCYCSVR